MSTGPHPYSQIPDHQRWSRSMGRVEPADVDPVVAFPFRLSRRERIATAGSCFAQHIGRHLAAGGYGYLVTEPGHPILPDRVKAEFGYGVFTARYGNVYTSTQLLQLFRRAYGTFAPLEDVWRDGDRFVDPFRPTIQPSGFATEIEFRRDREQHFEAVRRAFEELDVLVFTLGLTECWADARDGAIFPVAPGVAGGEYDPLRHEFRNLTLEEVLEDMSGFLAELGAVNPSARVILTVSPVPLAATALDRHVLVSTTYSKAVLRVAADVLANRHQNVAYFPAYEIVTGNHARGSYFADDLRSVREEGVEHVMSLFFRHATVHDEPVPAPRERPEDDTYADRVRDLVTVLCDEELLDTR